MKDSIKDQDEMTKEGLEFLQVSTNKAALENMCKEQKEQIDRAQLEWQESECARCRFRALIMA